MKPLVYYCRWQGATLRLRGRDKTAVWGHLVFTDDDGNETEQPFRYLLTSQTLFLDDSEEPVQLDDMGVVVESTEDANTDKS